MMFLFQINNEESLGESHEDNSAATKFGISATTRCVDIIPTLCKKFLKNQHPKHYRLKPPNQGL